MNTRDLSDKQRIWLKHVEGCALAGVSMRAYADRHGLDVQRFYVWKSQLKQLGVLGERDDQPLPPAPSPLIRAQVVSQPSRTGHRQAAMCAARIALDNGITIEVPAGLAPQALCRLIGAAMRLAPVSEGEASR
jgi:hypothetical protein